MNRFDHLERDLTVWFADVATPRVPDYVTDIVQSTAGRPQRRRWTFLDWWLPMTLVRLHPVPTDSFPWRTIGVLALIAALAAALVVVGVGSLRRTPAPFGLAANGLMAYAASGDVYVVDPQTGGRRALVSGPEEDHDPRWSPDGARVAFLRDLPRGQQVVIISADDSRPAVVASRTLGFVDPDSFKWAPDGQALLVATDEASTGNMLLIDASDGAVTALPVDRAELEPHWRPPDGRELLFVSGSSSMAALSLYDLDTGVRREIPIPPGQLHELRPMGWTPDGTRVLVHRWSEAHRDMRTFVIDVETGDHVILDVGYGHVSNAGDRVAGLLENGNREGVCVIDIEGTGPCVPVGPARERPEGSHAEALQWSPDDRWLVVQPETGDPPLLLDPTTGAVASGADWIRDGAESWQRRAP